MNLALGGHDVLGLKLGDPRVFLFRYVLPGLVFLIYSGLYLRLMLPTLSGRLIELAPQIIGLAVVLSLVSLVGVGLVLRTYPFDHWFPVYLIVKRYYSRLHEVVLKYAPKLGLVGEGIPDKKKPRVFWDYLANDVFDSPGLRFQESAYIWWFNFATIVCLFLFAVLIGIIADPYIDIISINSRQYLIYAVLGSIGLLIPIVKRAFNTLETYVNLGIILVERVAKSTDKTN